MTRVHLPLPLATGTRLVLPEAAAHHLVQVLRMKPGERFIAFNGDGGEFEAELVSAGKREAQAQIGRFHDVQRESPLRVVLAQCVSKGERMDYTLQKAVELGVAEVQPLLSSRSVVRLDAERWQKKLEHWNGVIISACEQSGRTRVPQLRPVLPLEQWLAVTFTGTALVLAPGAAQKLAALPAPNGAAALLVGPEGGLTEEEIALARRQGYSALSLGPRILRTETAGVAALAVLQARWGDLN